MGSGASFRIVIYAYVGFRQCDFREAEAPQVAAGSARSQADLPFLLHRPRHKKPNAGEIAACRWWIEKEIAIVRPRLIVALGATAAAALTGRAVPVTRERGPATFDDGPGFITVHPSFLLRIPDADEKAHQYALFVADLRKAGALAGG